MSRTKGDAHHKRESYDWIAPGVPCWYQPGLESKPFAGVVETGLRLSRGELVCSLVDMDSRYFNRTGHDRVERVCWLQIRKRRIANETKTPRLRADRKGKNHV